ncbi:MAG: DNA polymerase III subunit gamma/tau, partial [Candidatus Magasanikbacteria bacterium]|nr:DNA polymerase III subunit gamma/tau [Candidatus Magasanikbacteria bacterium]
MALYHTHRPQTFDHLTDQAHIVITLTNQLINNKTAHAYLFSGPRGVGKTTTARILAKSLNCTHKKEGTANPCNTCNSCTEITNSRSIDVIEIDAASYTGVDNVRENIIDSAQFKPTMSRYKIFIIDEVHMLSTAAFNALLKTLEEPPKYIVFILATTDSQKLPATIISRCQRFGFHKVSDEEMTKHINNIAKIEQIKIDDEVVRRIVKKSEGCARDAVNLLDQLMAAGDAHITIDSASYILPTTQIELQMNFVEKLLKKQDRDALAQISDMVLQGMNLPHFTRELIEFMRVLMIARVDIELAQKEIDLSKEAGQKLKELVSISSQSEICTLIDITLRRNGEIKTSPLPQLPLEMLVVEWCIHDDTQKVLIQPQAAETKNTPIMSDSKDTQLESQLEIVQGANTRSIDQKTFESKWGDCLKEIEVQTPSLVFILKMAEFIQIENNVVQFSVPYDFHREKLMEKITKEKIELILSNLFGSIVLI